MENNYEIKITMPTIVLAIILYTLLTFASGIVIGMIVSRQSMYIAHYHASEVGYPMEGNIDISANIKKEKKK